MYLSALSIYPVKSMAGIRLKESELEITGLKNDRRWMLVNPDGQFLTQRQYPQLALIQPELQDGRLILHSHNHGRIEVPDINQNDRLQVCIWKDEVQANAISKDVDDWLFEVLKIKCHLVGITDANRRQVDLNYAKTGDLIRFADAFPLLVTTEASLADLNRRLTTDIEMNRFRPNIVISGDHAPFDEDKWATLAIADTRIRLCKPCSRCVIPTINPQTAQKDRSDVLVTLSQFRKDDKGIYFGQNATVTQSGHLKLGDSVEIQSQG